MDLSIIVRCVYTTNVTYTVSTRTC